MCIVNYAVIRRLRVRSRLFASTVPKHYFGSPTYMRDDRVPLCSSFQDYADNPYAIEAG